jgi:hypothetical protein
MTIRTPSAPDPEPPGGRPRLAAGRVGMRALLPVAFLGGMGFLFTTHPAAIRYFGVGMVVFAVAVFGLILAAYAFVYAAPQRAKRAGFTLSDASYVGYDEGNTRLSLIEEGGAACRVEMTRGYYALSVVALSLGGPGLLLGLLANPRPGQWANPMMIFAALFSVGLSVLLAWTIATYLFRRPSLRMEPGVVAFRRGRSEVRRFTRKDIEDLSVDDHRYVNSEGGAMRSAILVAHLADGSTKRLVASRNSGEVEEIAKRMRFLLGLRGG